MSRRTLPSYKNIYLRRLNDLHIGAQVVVAAVRKDGAPAANGGKPKSHYQYFEVPSGKKPTARIRRERRDVETLVTRIADRAEYENALVVAVSVVEDYFANLVRVMLRAHPERLARGLKGGETSISLELFVTKDRDVLLGELIEQRITKALYHSPAEYIEYLGRTLQVGADPEVVARFFEVKATRDITIHANGRANQVYVQKAGALARAEAGADLPIDRAYFDGATSTMKALIIDIHGKVSAKYAEDEVVLAAASRLLL